jgi:hypothetical protein
MKTISDYQEKHKPTLEVVSLADFKKEAGA